MGRVDADEHRADRRRLLRLHGRPDRALRAPARERDAGGRRGQEYERAARLRDDVGALRRAMEKQAVVLADGTDADVVAFAEDELEAAVQVFYVRGGRVRGQRGWVVDKIEEVDDRDAGRAVPAQGYRPSRPRLAPATPRRAGA